MSAARHLDQFPLLLTAGDHALLTPAIVDEFCRAALAVEADMIVGLVPYACVQAAYPHSIRTRLRFRDGHCCGSNLFLLKRTGALAVLDFWRDLEAARKQPWRMAARLGLVPLWRYLVSGLDVADAFALLSQRVGARLGFVPLRHARAAIDVDSSADLELAREIIAHDRA